MFNLFVLLFIFTTVNKKFSVGFDWRYLTVALGLSLTFLKLLQIRFTVGARRTSLLLFFGLAAIIALGAFYRLYTAQVINRTIFYKLLSSYFANFVYLMTFALYYSKIDNKLFSNFYFFSLLFLLGGVIAQMMGMDIFSLSYFPPFKGSDVHTYYVETFSGLNRYSGWIYGPNWVPLVTFPYLAYLYAVRENRRLLKTLILVPLLLIPLSKTFFVAFVISLTAIMLTKLNKRNLTFFLMYLVSIFSVITYLIFHYRDQLFYLFSLKSMAMRFIMWENLFDKFGSHCLFGYGLEASRNITVGLSGVDQYGTIHNTFLAILYDHGAVGLMLFAVLTIMAFVTLRNSSYRLLWLFTFLYGMTLEFGYSSIAVLVYYVIPLVIKRRSTTKQPILVPTYQSGLKHPEDVFCVYAVQ